MNAVDKQIWRATFEFQRNAREFEKLGREKAEKGEKWDFLTFRLANGCLMDLGAEKWKKEREKGEENKKERRP